LCPHFPFMSLFTSHSCFLFVSFPFTCLSISSL
jgi:hypothetical protein